MEGQESLFASVTYAVSCLQRWKNIDATAAIKLSLNDCHSDVLSGRLVNVQWGKMAINRV